MMNVNLILFRHGQAESLDSCKDDFNRALTQNGIDTLKKNISNLRTLLKSDQKIYLWSSPVLRAKQTAEIIGAELNIEEYLCFDFIRTGDDSLLAAELQKLEPPFSLVLVGHEPYLSNWSSKICGHKVSFYKGTAACFGLPEPFLLQGVLEWICQPNTPRIKESLPAKKLVRSVLLFHLQEILIAQSLFLHSPDDIEAVHQLRVKIRQFRSLLSFIEPLLDRETYDNIQNQMRNLAGKLACLRNIDVMAETWKEFNLSFSDKIGNEDTFSKSLNKERNLQKSNLLTYLTTNQPLEFYRGLWMWLFDESWEDETNISFKTFSRKRFETWSEKYLEEFLQMELSCIESIHTIRIKTKKLRYSISILGTISGKKIKIPFDLKQMQDLLGDYIDMKTGILLVEEMRMKYRSISFQYQSGILAGYYMCRGEQLRKEIIAIRLTFK